MRGERADEPTDARVAAVLEVLGGCSVAKVAERWAVDVALVHRWVRGFVEAGTAQVTITVGNPPAPPTPVIDTPTTALHWQVGDPIDFSGHAADGTGAALPASALTWLSRSRGFPARLQ